MMTMAAPLVTAVGGRGKAYDNRRVRCYLRCRGIKARIARIGVDSKQ